MSAFDDWNTMERLAQLDPMRQVREANRVIDDLLASSRWHSDYISQSMKDLIGVACPSIAGADFLARQSAMAWTPKYPSWNESSAFSELAEAGEKLRGVGLVKNAGLELQADQVRRACELFEVQIGKTFSKLIDLNPYAHLAATLSMMRDGILTRASSVLTASAKNGLLTLVRAWDVSTPDLLHLPLCDTSNPESDDAPEEVIEVRCDIVCRFCGALLISEPRTFSVDSDGYLHSEVAIVPLCSNCEKAQLEDPHYLERRLADLERERRPRLILIPGGGQTSARRSVAFRIIRQEVGLNSEDK